MSPVTRSISLRPRKSGTLYETSNLGFADVFGLNLEGKEVEKGKNEKRKWVDASVPEEKESSNGEREEGKGTKEDCL